MKFVPAMFQGDVQLAIFQINFINLNVMYVLFLKPLGKPS